MAHYVICTYCNQKFNRDKEPFVPDGNRYMHQKCYEHKIGQMSEEEIEYGKLENYIKSLFGVNYINKKIITQIKEYRQTYGYTYSGMRKALIWWFEMQKNSIKDANGGIRNFTFYL